MLALLERLLRLGHAGGGLDLSSPARARAALKDALPGWAPALLALVDECDGVVVPRPIVALPVGHRWAHREGVTLIGDAAHVMSPFSGEGVNMAMLDATELALQLSERADLNDGVAAYEARMFVRAAEAAAGAEEGLAFVSEDGIAHVLAHFGSVTGAHDRKGQRTTPHALRYASTRLDPASAEDLRPRTLSTRSRMKQALSLFARRNASVAAWALSGIVVAACGSDDASIATADGGASLDGTVPPSPRDGGASDAEGDVGTDGATSDDGAAPRDGASDTGHVPSACNGATASTSTPVTGLPASPAVTLPSGFKIETVAKIGSARELVALPNGDLLVATSGTDVLLVPNAEAAGSAGAPVTFTSVADSPVQGIAFDPASCTVYVASHTEIHAMAYVDAQTSAPAGDAIAHVRTGAIAPNSDGDVHVSTSLAFAGGTLYAGVGSSCNACTEVDGTRATVQAMHPDGSSMTTRATRFRNAIALATNPATGTLWAGGAGQDTIATGHPYELFDAVTLHAGTADYGWPECEENHVAYKAGADCSTQVVPLIEFPAYSTLIGATFYPQAQGGAHAFPAAYRGGLFITAHGSWHTTGGKYFSPPRVAFVAMNGDAPKVAVDWNDPSKQWTELVGGYQLADGVKRIGRPTGIAVGSQGSLFVADDQNGAVYRIRPK